MDEAKLSKYGSYVEKFLKIYKTAKINELVELATEFKDTMYIDWQSDNIPVGKNLAAYKNELIELLNDMERYIRA